LQENRVLAKEESVSILQKKRLILSQNKQKVVGHTFFCLFHLERENFQFREKIENGKYLVGDIDSSHGCAVVETRLLVLARKNYWQTLLTHILFLRLVMTNTKLNRNYFKVFLRESARGFFFVGESHSISLCKLNSMA
jgi:hypothetical protein